MSNEDNIPKIIICTEYGDLTHIYSSDTRIDIFHFDERSGSTRKLSIEHICPYTENFENDMMRIKLRMALDALEAGDYTEEETLELDRILNLLTGKK